VTTGNAQSNREAGEEVPKAANAEQGRVLTAGVGESDINVDVMLLHVHTNVAHGGQRELRRERAKMSVIDTCWRQEKRAS
jgi:hypothetical protein